MTYSDFVHSKSQLRGYFGFQAKFFPDRAKNVRKVAENSGFGEEVNYAFDFEEVRA